MKGAVDKITENQEHMASKNLQCVLFWNFKSHGLGTLNKIREKLDSRK